MRPVIERVVRINDEITTKQWSRENIGRRRLRFIVLVGRHGRSDNCRWKLR